MLDIPGGGGAPTNPFLQGGGDGGSGGGGGGYNYSTDTQPTQPLFSETNPFRNYFTNPSPFPSKDSPINSPDLSPDYESIKHRFQAYDDLLSGRNNIKEELKEPPSSKPEAGVERDPQLRTALQNYNW
ncbi:hypothetical protein E2C01_008263 [Portunus trituberculatus]|uniref:Uncharacterized protein n=2 Tax=Portunus trituberculatus TaxID=210409 RepID=A0A5B7D0A5_PORTR|nr:hypothetical protein [Portunus trituberculatus]